MAPMLYDDPILVDGRDWLFPDGRSIRLIAGGDGNPDPDPKPDPDPDPKPHPAPDPKPPDPGDLGDAGKRALDSERAARRAAEKRAKDAEAERDRLKQQNESEQEKAVREASDSARTEERQKAHRQILRAEVKARAGTKVADPEDAVRLLDLDSFEVSDEGEVDVEKIDKAIDKLLEKKPYLKAGQTQGTKPTVDGGARPPNDDKEMDVAKRLERIKAATGIR